MSSQYRHKRDDSYVEQERPSGRSERRRSRSNSRPRRHRAKDSRSRSRSQSPERRRHRRRASHSRSPSQNRRVGGGRGGYSGRNDRRYNSRRYKDSRSRSRSVSNSRSQARHRSRSPPRFDDRHRNQGGGADRWHDQRREKVSDVLEDHASSTTSSDASVPYNPFDGTNLEHLPLPKQRDAISAYYHMDAEEPIDKERIHREMEEKLRAALAKEGKVYPPPKPEASHPVFANDGSFIEIFKKMQEAQKQPTSSIAAVVPAVPVASTSTAAFATANGPAKTAPPPLLVGRRRGGKILKTGVVAKQKAPTEPNADPKDFWSLYLAEVNKYKNNACESDGGTRPLVK